MTTGQPTRRSRPYIHRKPDSYIAVWLPRVEDCVTNMDVWFFEGIDKEHYYKVSHISDWMDERYPVFRGFKPLFKKIVVGKCLKFLNFEKYTYSNQGWIYRRKKVSE